MLVSISRPELLEIMDETGNESFFGGIQDWYIDGWSRRAGCGPTCAANVLAYLALGRPELRALYGYRTMGRADFSAHMEEVFRFVTPGMRGLNRVEMFTQGVEAFAHSRGIALRSHVFDVAGNMVRDRAHVSELAAFVKEGLEADCPVAFLNLTRGRVKNLQGWHWITITSADIEPGCIVAYASDEGRRIEFDLRLWYLRTRMQGGLVYFTHGG